MRRRDFCGAAVLAVPAVRRSGNRAVAVPIAGRQLAGAAAGAGPVCGYCGGIESILLRPARGVPLTSWATRRPLAPLGFLSAAVLAVFWRARRTILSGFGVSLSIELIQLCCGRRTSVDDLLLNTLGAAAGFALAKLLLCACPRSAPARQGRAEWARIRLRAGWR